MAKVSLRVYNREIESMIEVGKLDEAIAHCQHILKIFPMHVETYRLLGKSFLETKRYKDAADIFQRTLMAVPDDFVAHVGMSIIRDDEGQLDDAIWHMERAFEGQPSNPAIQGELRRLFGRRDGVEPLKIRLSRDALANMYAQGSLFNQAIAEIRAVLAEDPNRSDLQVMLARAYFRSGQKVEAAEMAANLLKKYIYCLDALRILVDVLPGSARAENTQVYRQRLSMLDPYSSFVTGSMFNIEQVEDTTVTLERLDYTASSSPALQQANWVSSLGIRLTGERPIDLESEQIKSEAITESSITAETNIPNSPEVPGAEVPSIPDWMRSADWVTQESKSTELTEEPTGLIPGQPAGQIAQADIPEWLNALAPQGIADSENNPRPVSADKTSSNNDDTPSWLQGITPQKVNEGSENSPIIPPMTEDEQTGDKYDDLKSSTVEAKKESMEPVKSSSGDNSLPDWISGVDELPETVNPLIEAMDGLNQNRTNSQDESQQAALTSPSSQTTIEPPVAGSQEINALKLETSDALSPIKEDEDTNAWLEELTTKQGIIDENLLTKPEDDLAGIPDWLMMTDVEQVMSSKPEILPTANNEITLETDRIITQSNTEPAIAEPENGTQKESSVEQSTQPLISEGETKTRLEELGDIPEEKEEPHNLSDSHLLGIPDWLRSAEESPLASSLPEISNSTPENPPSELLRPVIEEPKIPEPIQIENQTIGQEKLINDKPDWLRVSEERKDNSKETPTQTETGIGDRPDWLRSIEELPASLAANEPSQLPEDTSPIEPVSQSKEVIPGSDSASMEVPIPQESPVDRQEEPLNIEDEKIAWLDDLTGQTKDQEASLTKPEGLNNEKPDWLTSIEEKLESQAPIKPLLNPSEGLPFEETPIEAEAVSDLESKSEAGSQSTNQMEDFEIKEIENDPLAWLDGIRGIEEAKPEEDRAKESASSERPDIWIPDASDNISSKGSPEVKNREDDITITSWLSKKEVEEAVRKSKTSSEVAQAAAADMNDLPDWLKDTEELVLPEEEKKPVDTLPDWLRQPAQPADQVSTQIRAAKLEKESELPAWIDEEISISSTSKRTIASEWVPIEEAPALGVENGSFAETETISVDSPLLPRYPKPTGILAVIPAKDKDAELLTSAQTLLEDNKLNEAMQAYSLLIKKNRLLDEVIHDLREAIYRFPVDIIVWQTLGDASIRANRLQDALDAYTKAEELLR